MLEPKTPKESATNAHTLADGLNLVRYRDKTYIPADFETFEVSTPPQEERRIWLPLGRKDLRRIAADRFSQLFKTDGELASFEFQVAQNCLEIDRIPDEVFIRTPEGLRALNSDGQLVDPSGRFVPNVVKPMLNTEPEDIELVQRTLLQWLNAQEEVDSLLRHLATVLAPHYSAVKYVLLIGEGRNGKSVLLKMVQKLFGIENVAHVTRQAMAESNPVVTELNGKLLNLVFDGRAEYLKDSAVEKSLVAGEEVPIRKLYESESTIVQTNALFIEGLNREPKSTDKSSALQKRLVRFEFPNVFALDHRFEKTMLSESVTGALLKILIDHYVHEFEVAEALAPTTRAIELQLEHMYINSLELQFLKHVHENEPLGIEAIVGETITEVVQRFQSWRVKENDIGTWAEPDVIQRLTPLLNTERKSVRTPDGPRKKRIVTSLKLEARQFIDSINEEVTDAAQLEPVVDA